MEILVIAWLQEFLAIAWLLPNPCNTVLGKWSHFKKIRKISKPCNSTVKNSQIVCNCQIANCQIVQIVKTVQLCGDGDEDFPDCC